MLFAPLEGWRHFETDRHTAVDYAHVLKDLADRHFPHTKTIVLVQDNLNIPARRHSTKPFRPGLSRQGYSMPSLGTAGFPKREIFNDEVAIAPRKRATTSAARYLAISGFCTDLGLDDVVGGIAFGASEKRLIYCRMTRRLAP